MINNITLFFLEFTHETLIIPIIILGFIWLNRETFYHAICLSLLSMLYSYDLKTMFQISSPAYGLIFPSGHMLGSTVLYAWLAHRFNNKILTLLTLILLCGIGTSLIYQNYHDIYDVIAGLFFGILFLIIYNYILLKEPKALLSVSLIFASLSMLYLYIRLGHLLPHLWLAFYALIGFTISIKIFNGKIELHTKTSKFISSILCLLCILAINYIFSLTSLPIFLFQLKWLFISTSVPFSCFSAKLLIK